MRDTGSPIRETQALDPAAAAPAGVQVPDPASAPAGVQVPDPASAPAGMQVPDPASASTAAQAPASEPAARTLSPDELNALVQRQFPDYAACRVTDASGTHLLMEADGARLRTRPGGTISGPEQAGLVDLAAFLLINARLGRPTPMALTTSLQISYLNRPRPGLLRTHARMAKFGRRLCVVLAELRDEAGDLAASATVTYSVPPAGAGQGTG
ncbi:hotdog domain-containing protein [Streptomyces sp. NPDC056194]|uniref:PaaI family thioesterase n=1 Tax=unclassified Streptomyces TaxID=2593676 RepID=UPI0035DFAF4A